MPSTGPRGEKNRGQQIVDEARRRARRLVMARQNKGRYRVPGLPTPVDPAVLEGRQREARRLRLMRGRAGTILTGPPGLTVPPPLGGLTLLGAGS